MKRRDILQVQNLLWGQGQAISQAQINVSNKENRTTSIIISDLHPNTGYERTVESSVIAAGRQESTCVFVD